MGAREKGRGRKKRGECWRKSKREVEKRGKVRAGESIRIELKKSKISSNLLQARPGYNKFLV